LNREPASSLLAVPERAKKNCDHAVVDRRRIMKTVSSSSQSTPAEEFYYEALDALSAEQPAEAVRLLRLSLKEDPRFLDALHGLIRALRESGELDEAIQAAHQLIALDPDDVLAHTSLSILYQHKGMIAEAEAEGLKAKLLGWKKQIEQERLSQP
jgi:tetratricopeptide (TPR) repeat protein